MFFLNLLLFAFFSAYASHQPDRLTVDSDMSNPYRSISYPARIKNQIRVFFDKPNFIKKHADTIITIDQKQMEGILITVNALNKILANCCNLPKTRKVFLQIPSISDMDPEKCTLLQNRRRIDDIEKIKELNTKTEFEIEDQTIIDPFRLSENIDAYKMVHSERIFTKSYYYSIALSAIISLIMLGLNKPMPSLPVATFFIPLFVNYKYIHYWAKSFFTKRKKHACFALIFIFLIAPVPIIYGANVLLHCIKQKLFI